jgi:hypothetical protein
MLLPLPSNQKMKKSFCKNKIFNPFYQDLSKAIGGRFVNWWLWLRLHHNFNRIQWMARNHLRHATKLARREIFQKNDGW